MKVCCCNCRYSYKNLQGEYICRAYNIKIDLKQDSSNCRKSRLCYALVDRTQEIEKMYNLSRKKTDNDI